MKDDNPLYLLSVLLGVLFINWAAGSYAIWVFVGMIVVPVLIMLVLWFFFDVL